ncbi:MAG: YqaJ viral recombinase family protein [Nitrosomonas sp.]|nr:YqaJ viral recombinase family protein [Nitrosomonas sp.]
MEFIISNIPNSAIVKPQQTAEASFEEDGVDAIDFVICFRPPLSVEEAKVAHVQVKYQCIVFGQHVFPAGKEPEGLEVQEEELNYLLFETHQLQYDRKKQTVDCMFLSLVNRSTHVSGQVSVEPQVDMHMHFFKTNFPDRFMFLDWFPCNVDPAMYGLKIDTRDIPQRTPLWFKVRGEVTGTRAYALIGFFVPSKSKDPDYSFFKSQTFTAFAKAAMRLGTLSEDAALLTYFNHFKTHVYKELGWCPAPPPLSKTWGASPDGLVMNEAMSWDQMPADLREHYEKKGYNIKYGALEIKTSRTKLTMEAYFYPQVYMEMIVLEVVWTNLIRYKPGFGAYVYRIYRDPAIEKQLIALWTRAFANASRLQDIIQEQEYVEMRAYFEKSASKLLPFEIIHESDELIKAYNDYKKVLVEPTLAHAPAPAPAGECLLLSGAREIYDGIQSKRAKVDVAKALVDHIGECTRLLKDFV